MVIPIQRQVVAGENSQSYLPLETSLKWVLRNPTEKKPVIFEVLRQEDESFVLRSTTPWNMSEWGLLRKDDRYLMTSYGTGGPTMVLPNRPLYLDFSVREGANWSSSLGKFSLRSRSVSVQSAERTYSNCVQIVHKAGGADLTFTFAEGVGYVQFGEGKNAFVLDEKSSSLPGRSNVPGNSASVLPALARDLPAAASAIGPLIGITPNHFANESMNLESMTNRFNDTVNAGATFLVGNGKWAELEPRPGKYSFESVQQFLSSTAQANLPVSFTLRVIDTVARDVPLDLRRKSWSDPDLEARLLSFVDHLIPLLRGRTKWFMLGYEVDGYFEHHRQEAEEFALLHRLVKERVKSIAPEIAVSSTVTFTGLDQLVTTLKTLNGQLDFLALTYCPLKPDFTVRDPSVVPDDFQRIRQSAAARPIVFQELAYPSSAAAGSSEAKQAQFYREVFRELASSPSPYSAVNLMTLADLSDADSSQFAAFYGLPNHAAFRATVQSLGMFDQAGRPKPSWTVVTKGVLDLQRRAR